MLNVFADPHHLQDELSGDVADLDVVDEDALLSLKNDVINEVDKLKEVLAEPVEEYGSEEILMDVSREQVGQALLLQESPVDVSDLGRGQHTAVVQQFQDAAGIMRGMRSDDFAIHQVDAVICAVTGTTQTAGRTLREQPQELFVCG